ncbi:hypothetical protein [Sphingomonas sp.]
MTNSEAAMADDSRKPGPGELANKRRQRRLWLVIAVLFATGFSVGFGTGYLEDDTGQGASLPAAWAIFAALVFTVAVTFGSWHYYRASDELARRDNLHAAGIGLNVFLVAFPVWFVLAKAGLVGQPDAMILFVLTLLATLMAFGWQRLRG